MKKRSTIFSLRPAGALGGAKTACGVLSAASLLGSLAIVVACSGSPSTLGAGLDGGDAGGADDAALDGGFSGDGAATDGPADPFANCKGIDLQNSGSLDVDLKVVRVRGRVTVDGAAASMAAQEIGRITFTQAQLKSSANVSIAADGHYETTLAPGTYDVGYAPNAEICDRMTAPGSWPCNTHVLKAGVTLAADGTLDLDLATVVIHGLATLRGQPFPQAPSITFAEPGTATVAAAPVTGQSYQIRLFKGSYAVGYAPPAFAPCGTTFPCNPGTLKPSVTLAASGPLDVDVPMAVTRGTVSLDGTLMSPTTRGGSISFSVAGAKLPFGGFAPGWSVAIAPDGTYALGLLPGTYAAAYDGTSTASATSTLPHGIGLLRPSVALTTDGTLDLDVPTLSIRGKVTINGAPAPASTTRGTISFTTPGIGSLGAPVLVDGTYASVLVAGTYEIGYSPGSSSTSSCPVDSAYPCNAATLQTRALPKGTGVLDLDLNVATVHGRMTLNGASLPPAANTLFVGVGFQLASDPQRVMFTELEADATYAARLMAGTYHLLYAGPDCTSKGSAMPCNTGKVRPSVPVTASGALDIDLPSTITTGHVTLAGQPLPTSPRGYLAFFGKSSGAAMSDPIAAGSGSYRAHVIRDRYVVTYQPELTCGDAPSQFPCVTVIVAGCE